MGRRLRFTKMHGLGNDYVYVSLFDQHVAQPEELARVLSDRRRGIGGDGLILVAPPDDDGAHVRMIVHNADGSRAEMCGNGIRCLAKLAYERGLARANPLRVQTDCGVRSLDLTLDGADRVTAVRADMGEPILDAKRIPVTVTDERVIGHPIWLAGVPLEMTCVSMGNPHAVFFHPDLKRVPLPAWGPALEQRPMFRDRINVHFVQVVRRDLVHMITWERGAGITEACGSGAAAACVAGVLNGLTGRAITVELPGGRLELEWDQASNHVFMTGPVEEVFSGEWPGA